MERTLITTDQARKMVGCKSQGNFSVWLKRRNIKPVVPVRREAKPAWYDVEDIKAGIAKVHSGPTAGVERPDLKKEVENDT